MKRISTQAFKNGLRTKTEHRTSKKGKDQIEDQIEAKQWFQRGLDFDNAKNYEKALWAYTKALEFDPGYLAAYNNRGNALEGYW